MVSNERWGGVGGVALSRYLPVVIKMCGVLPTSAAQMAAEYCKAAPSLTGRCHILHVLHTAVVQSAEVRERVAAVL